MQNFFIFYRLFLENLHNQEPYPSFATTFECIQSLDQAWSRVQDLLSQEGFLDDYIAVAQPAVRAHFGRKWFAKLDTLRDVIRAELSATPLEDQLVADGVFFFVATALKNGCIVNEEGFYKKLCVSKQKFERNLKKAFALAKSDGDVLTHSLAIRGLYTLLYYENGANDNDESGNGGDV